MSRAGRLTGFWRREAGTALIVFLGLMFVMKLQAQVIKADDPALSRIDVEEKLSAQIPLGLGLINSSGERVRLGEYFTGQRPVILVMAYYECPMLCTMVLNGLTKSVQECPMTFGKDYQILTVSIDPSETHQLAAGKRRSHLNQLQKEESEKGWEFFTASPGAIDSLANSIGFKYFYDEERDEYAHPAVITLLSPEGKISRYLYGIEFNPRDLKFALVEASQGKVGNTIDRLILYCYHYDPESKSYVLFAANVMKLGGGLTLGLLGLFLSFLWLREKRTKIAQSSGN